MPRVHKHWLHERPLSSPWHEPSIDHLIFALPIFDRKVDTKIIDTICFTYSKYVLICNFITLMEYTLYVKY